MTNDATKNRISNIKKKLRLIDTGVDKVVVTAKGSVEKYKFDVSGTDNIDLINKIRSVVQKAL